MGLYASGKARIKNMIEISIEHAIIFDTCHLLRVAASGMGPVADGREKRLAEAVAEAGQPRAQMLLHAPAAESGFLESAFSLYSNYVPQDFSDLLRCFQALSDEDFTVRLLSYADGGAKSESYYRRKTKEGPSRLVAEMPVSDGFKLELMYFLADTPRYRALLADILTRLYKITSGIYKTEKDGFAAAAARMGNADFMQEKLALLGVAPAAGAVLAPCLLAGQALHATKNPVILFAGAQIDQSPFYGDIPLDWNLIGKLFSDSRRCEIIERLAKEPMYLHQLAKKMKMPVSSAIYHIQLLADAKALLVETRGGRNYFSCNPAFFEAVSRFFSAYRAQLSGE